MQRIKFTDPQTNDVVEFAALKESGRLYEVMDYAMERICFYLEKRAKGRLEIDCIMYSNEFGELAKSRKAEKWFTLLAQEQAQQI